MKETIYETITQKGVSRFHDTYEEAIKFLEETGGIYKNHLDRLSYRVEKIQKKK